MDERAGYGSGSLLGIGSLPGTVSEFELTNMVK
jgi:hypothetical protein